MKSIEGNFDNPEVNEIISTFSDTRLSFFKRKKEDTPPSKSIVPLLEKIVTPIDSKHSGVAVLSYLQAPMVTTETLEEAISTLILNDACSSYGLEEVKETLYKRNSRGLLPINPSKKLTSDFDIVFRETNTSLATRNNNFLNGSLTGSKIVHFIVSKEECFFIDSEHSLKVANILFSEE